MYKLTISAQPKSKARLVDKLLRVKHFIVGRKYDINFVVKNISNEISPSGKIYIDIEWPETKASTTWEFTTKSLEPGECYISETKTYLALSTGLATITAYDRIASGSHEHKNVVELIIYRKDGSKKLGQHEAFGTIYATTPEAIYEYWALLIATVGILFAVVNWDLSRLKWLCVSLLILVVFRGTWNFLRARRYKICDAKKGDFWWLLWGIGMSFALQVLYDGLGEWPNLPLNFWFGLIMVAISWICIFLYNRNEVI